MKTIDERIVSIAFENKKFEANVATSMKTLQKLTDSINHMGAVHGFSDIEKASSKITFEGPMRAVDKLRSNVSQVGITAPDAFGEIDRAGSKVALTEPMTAVDKLRNNVAQVGITAPDAFGEIQKSAQRVDFSAITGALDGITTKFSTLQAAAAVALGGVATLAVTKGASVAKSLTLGPVTEGFSEYTTNLDSIQTILSNTQQSGATLDDVKKALNELNTYSDQTIYNFGQMAKNIGLFTAAGVDLDKSTASIKGIANLAALSGTNSEKASEAMRQLSQAIASGKVGVQDWNSVQTAGMGGVRFQNALVRTAQLMGTLDKKSVKIKDKMGNLAIKGESFRNSIMSRPGKEAWLTSDVLVSTFQQLTGDMTDAQLASQGFNEKQISDIQEMAKTAKNAATEVKGIKQVFDVAKEAIGTGWADTFQLMFGDFGEAKKTFTELSHTFGEIIGASAAARNKLIGDWKKLGGRTTLIKGIKVAWRDLLAVIKPIRQAFRDIFPPKTAGELLHTTRMFVHFVAQLRLGPEAAENLRRTFRGLFAIMSIGRSIVGDVIGMFKALLKFAGVGSGGILDFTGNIGDFLTSLNEAVTKGHALRGFFEGLTEVLKVPIELLRDVSKTLPKVFSGENVGNITELTDAFDGVGGQLKKLGGVFDGVIDVAKKFFGVLEDIRDTVSPVLGEVADKVGGVLEAIGDAFKTGDIETVSSVIQTALLGGIFIAIKKGLSKGLGGIKLSAFTADLDSLSNVFKALTGNLKAMQRNIQAATLLTIAVAIGALAAGVYILSGIDSKKLATALTAIAVGLGQLVGVIAILGRVAKFGGMKLGAIAAGMVLIAGAMVILAIAMKIFATMSWEEIAKGLAGVAGGLTAISLGMNMMKPSLRMAPGIFIVAIALSALGVAMKIFATMSWEEIAKGLVAIAFGLDAMAMGLRMMGPTMRIAPGILIIAGALILLSLAVRSFATLSWEDLAKGLLGVAAALGIIVVAMMFMPLNMGMQAAALVILAGALLGLAAVVKAFGSMDIVTLVKGMVAMAAALAILGVAMYYMIGTLPGAAALLVAAGALAILTPTLAFMGSLKWTTIIKGLIGIALVLTLLAVAGTFAAAPISALGIALLPLAGFFILSAMAVFIFAKALQALGSAGTKSVAVLLAAITGMALLLPKILFGLVKDLVDIAAEIAKVAPKITEALAVIIMQIVDLVIKIAPKLAVAIGLLVGLFVKVIGEQAPRIINAGLTLLVKFLEGIANNIGKVTENVALIITRFLTALTDKGPDLLTAGFNFLMMFLGGIADHAKDIAEAAGTIITQFITGLGNKVDDLILAAGNILIHVITGMGENYWRFLNAGVDVILKFLHGIGTKAKEIVDRGVWVAGRIIGGFAKGMVDLAETAAQAVIDFLNGMAQVIRENDQELIDAIENLADSIIDALVLAIRELAWKPVKEIKKIPGKMFRAIKGKAGFDSKSPSKAFMKIGADTMVGLAMGIESGGRDAVKATGQSSSSIVQTAQKTLSNVPGLLDGIMDVDPTIRPVLDLSQVEKDASKIGDITKTSPIQADVAFGQASAISREKAASDQVAAEMAAVAAEPKVQFEQNNFSPEALPAIEIYRRTNNQLSQIRKAAGLVSGAPAPTVTPWGGTGV